MEGSDYDAGVEQGRILTQESGPRHEAGARVRPARDGQPRQGRPVGVVDDMSSMLHRTLRRIT
ncbi:MAG: hypothetical protein ACLU3I_11185 [Acutalibacteraceae bacterium]